jgi:2-oxo-4-hydroxy-4-carboxy-5-ureidoimidazoline decarboxylase
VFREAIMTEQRTLSVDQFNRLGDGDARAALARCCGAGAWADAVLARRPFATFDDVLIASDEAFATLDEPDWLEAFRAHPRIGDRAALRERFASTADWAAGEQAGAAGAPDDVLDALAEANAAYERKFGHLFVVSATGKSAAEMLAAARDRLTNDEAAERAVVRGELAKITKLRMERLYT